ncbi:NEK1 [Symbiodinium sp. CCMP2592]|nr:NEK1 [Symbiodinium sp. CCMP2592]
MYVSIVGLQEVRFGVKQHEGKKYLFGPGIKDHIPGLGFGQMGMGDYDKRLAAFCKMFVEELGEEKLQQLYQDNRQLNHTQLCLEECLSSASGTGVGAVKKPSQVSAHSEASASSEARFSEGSKCVASFAANENRRLAAVLDELTKRAKSTQKAERAEL